MITGTEETSALSFVMHHNNKTKTYASLRTTWYCFHVSMRLTPETNKHDEDGFGTDTKV